MILNTIFKGRFKGKILHIIKICESIFGVMAGVGLVIIGLLWASSNPDMIQSMLIFLMTGSAAILIMFPMFESWSDRLGYEEPSIGRFAEPGEILVDLDVEAHELTSVIVHGIRDERESVTIVTCNYSDHSCKRYYIRKDSMQHIKSMLNAIITKYRTKYRVLSYNALEKHGEAFLVIEDKKGSSYDAHIFNERKIADDKFYVPKNYMNIDYKAIKVSE